MPEGHDLGMMVLQGVLALLSVGNLLVVIRAAWSLSERLTRVDERLAQLAALPDRVNAIDDRLTKAEYDLENLFEKLREARVFSPGTGSRPIKGGS